MLRRFYRDTSENDTWTNSGFGHEWAERGTRLVFQEADEPDEENIPAFINLALFWYSEGKWQKSNMLRRKHKAALGFLVPHTDDINRQRRPNSTVAGPSYGAATHLGVSQGRAEPSAFLGVLCHGDPQF